MRAGGAVEDPLPSIWILAFGENLVNVSAQRVITLLSESEPMLLMLPLTPLVGLYGWSAGSSFTRPEASARLPAITMVTASATAHTFFIRQSPFVVSEPMVARPCCGGIKRALQTCYGLSLKR